MKTTKPLEEISFVFVHTTKNNLIGIITFSFLSSMYTKSLCILCMVEVERVPLGQCLASCTTDQLLHETLMHRQLSAACSHLLEGST